MIAAIVLIALMLVLAFYLARRDPPQAPPPSKEAMQKAAIDLHRISRNLDVATLKHEQRREASRVKRELAETFDRDQP
jgi:hypothetical protein